MKQLLPKRTLLGTEFFLANCKNAFCWRMERWMTLAHLRVLRYSTLIPLLNVHVCGCSHYIKLRRVSRILVSCRISSKIHRRAPPSSCHTWKWPQAATRFGATIVLNGGWCVVMDLLSVPGPPQHAPQSSRWQPKEPPYRVNHYIPTPTLIDYPHTKAGGAVNPRIGCRLRWQNSRLSL